MTTLTQEQLSFHLHFACFRIPASRLKSRIRKVKGGYAAAFYTCNSKGSRILHFYIVKEEFDCAIIRHKFNGKIPEYMNQTETYSFKKDEVIKQFNNAMKFIKEMLTKQESRKLK